MMGWDPNVVSEMISFVSQATVPAADDSMLEESSQSENFSMDIRYTAQCQCL